MTDCDVGVPAAAAAAAATPAIFTAKATASSMLPAREADGTASPGATTGAPVAASGVAQEASGRSFSNDWGTAACSANASFQQADPTSIEKPMIGRSLLVLVLVLLKDEVVDIEGFSPLSLPEPTVAAIAA